MFARRTRRHQIIAGCAALLVAAPAWSSEALIDEVTDLNVAWDRTHDAIVFDLYGTLWSMPADGGVAERLPDVGSALNRPAVSPDGRWLAVEHCPNVHCSLQLIDRHSGAVREVMAGPWSNVMPTFSADSRWLAFASSQAGSFGIWRFSLAGGAAERVSVGAGDALWPAFAADSNTLVWVARQTDGNALMQRRWGGSAEVLYTSAQRLEAPTFRPDDSLIAFIEGTGKRELRFLLNDASGVVKTMYSAADLEADRPIWIDRHSLLLSAGGRPVRWRFGEPSPEPLSLQAFVSIAEQPATRSAVPTPPEPNNHGRYVLRVGRTYDSVTGRLGGPADIVIVDDRIESIGPPRAHDPATVVFDTPGLTAVPGLVALHLGPAIGSPGQWLRRGFTHVVCVHSTCAEPAPRIVAVDVDTPDGTRLQHVVAARRAGFGVLSSRLYPDIAAGATLWLARAVPNRIYDDYSRLLRERRAAIVLPAAGVVQEAFARARALTHRVLLAADHDPDRFAERLVELAQADIVAHGTAADLLRSLTVDAALEAGIAAEAGRIAAGRTANLILVAGDPLTEPAALFRPAAIVRGGRYWTPAGLFANDNSN